MTEPIIDSQLSPFEAVAQNPENRCPNHILQTLEIAEVAYDGFDDREHIGQIVMARAVIDDVMEFFYEARERNFPIQKVIPAADPRYKWRDESLMGDNVSSGFNYRPIAGTNTLSQHSRGLAFDINPRQNPYIRYTNEGVIVQPFGAVWNSGARGTLHAGHPLVELMEERGWEWGGSWPADSGRIDYQHFEKHL